MSYEQPPSGGPTVPDPLSPSSPSSPSVPYDAATTSYQQLYAASSVRSQRRLRGSIGLVLAIPVVAAIAAFLAPSGGGPPLSYPDISVPGIVFPTISIPPIPAFGAGPHRRVTPGAAFVLGGVGFRAGWRVAAAADGTATVVGLRLRDPRSARSAPAVTVRLLGGGHVLTAVACIFQGPALPLYCDGPDPLPARYGGVTVTLES